MALDAADLTRIIKYRAYNLGSQAGGPLTYNSLLELVRSQIAQINDIDAEEGTTLGDEIKTDLNLLDTLDGQRTSSAGSSNVKVLGIGSGIEYFPGGQTQGFTEEMSMIRARIARMLSQSFGGEVMAASPAYRS